MNIFISFSHLFCISNRDFFSRGNTCSANWILDIQFHSILIFFCMPQHLKHLIVHNCWVAPINKIEIYNL